MKSRRKRNVMSDINVVPYIDVMLVLLVIFMVTAPLITTGVIDLPEVSKSAPKKESIIEIKILKNESIKVRKREIGFLIKEGFLEWAYLFAKKTIRFTKVC